MLKGPSLRELLETNIQHWYLAELDSEANIHEFLEQRPFQYRLVNMGSNDTKPKILLLGEIAQCVPRYRRRFLNGPELTIATIARKSHGKH